MIFYKNNISIHINYDDIFLNIIHILKLITIYQPTNNKKIKHKVSTYMLNPYTGIKFNLNIKIEYKSTIIRIYYTHNFEYENYVLENYNSYSTNIEDYKYIINNIERLLWHSKE